MKISSDFAILDVKDGRHELSKHFSVRENNLGPCPEELRIPITITGYIDSQWGRDDGTSIEFGIQVEHLTQGRAYQLSYSIPYEGTSIKHFSTLDEITTWLRANRSTYEGNLDNVDIIEVARSVDVYDLMRDTQP